MSKMSVRLLILAPMAVQALQPTALNSRMPMSGSVQRSRKLVAQYAQDLPTGWNAGIDPASGSMYYFNKQTGQSQWEPPQWEPPQTSPAYAQQSYERVAGQLDLDQYRTFVNDRGERVTETELRRRFDELDNHAQSYNYASDGARQFTGGRDQFIQGRGAGSYKGGAYNFAGQQMREITPLVEFLRWQEWYVQYCKLRNIGQGA
eukprot:CAMPEP_0119072416 /NCGR_PEP_ID=MMETSP1178-20130426/58354_1 /TAXON_ID=33656 /ORGANISM="unid sp, Strain CCMP2000" /LENGTH=203 /DNA_ID=CAMNT_0007054415 /DNA_START=58 /DNA_END=669 /DNA_ORIENTATION=-